MARRVKNMLTPEQQYQAGRQQEWREENAESLHYRGLLKGHRSKRSEERIDADFPLTPKPAPITDEPKKRGWRR